MTVPIKNAGSVMSIPKIFATIDKTLVAHKAAHITYSYENERIAAIEFVLDINHRDHPFRLPARVKAVEKILYPYTAFLSKTQKEQAYRVAWANIRDWVGAQCALIDTGMVSAEEVFLPYKLATDGKTTFFEALREQEFRLALPEPTYTIREEGEQ